MNDLLSWIQGPTGWFLLGLLLLILEFVVPGLVLIFFGLGALATGLLVSLVDLPVPVQVLIFALFSVGMLLGLRKWSKPIFYGQSSQSPDEEELVGARGRVSRAIRPPEEGRVNLHGVEWTASSDTAVEEGCLVQVCSRDNLTLHVEQIS